MLVGGGLRGGAPHDIKDFCDLWKRLKEKVFFGGSYQSKHRRPWVRRTPDLKRPAVPLNKRGWIANLRLVHFYQWIIVLSRNAESVLTKIHIFWMSHQYRQNSGSSVCCFFNIFFSCCYSFYTLLANYRTRRDAKYFLQSFALLPYIIDAVLKEMLKLTSSSKPVWMRVLWLEAAPFCFPYSQPLLPLLSWNLSVLSSLPPSLTHSLPFLSPVALPPLLSPSLIHFLSSTTSPFSPSLLHSPLPCSLHHSLPHPANSNSSPVISFPTGQMSILTDGSKRPSLWASQKRSKSRLHYFTVRKLLKGCSGVV